MRQSAARQEDTGPTALAGLALLALALAGGCLAVTLARTENLRLRG